MMHDQAIPILYRQHAFAELVDAAAGVDAPDAVLRIIENYETQKMDEPVVQRVMATRRRVLTDIMEGRTNDVGARLVIKEVADYVLKDASRPDREAVTRARALLWMGHVKKAEATLRSALGDPDLFDIHWDARAHLVRLLRDEGRVAEALAEARRLVEIAPWRAGSYDELRRVAEKIGNLEMVQNAKESGDRVYEEELELFKRLRQAIE